MKIAILGSYSTQILAKSLSQINSTLEVYEADYAQVDYEIINDDSQLYKFSPDVVVILESLLSFKSKYASLNNPNPNKLYEY